MTHSPAEVAPVVTAPEPLHDLEEADDPQEDPDGAGAAAALEEGMMGKSQARKHLLGLVNASSRSSSAGTSSAPGVSGTGWGTVGGSNQGTLHGRGTGSGWGVAITSSSTSKVPAVRMGSPTVKGDLDKSIIRRYIRRNLSKIKYCYEKQLLIHPGLSGTVKIDFVIAANGSVTKSTAVGVDADVSSCLAETIRKIQFPMPTGVGQVVVKYPFRFNPPAH